MGAFFWITVPYKEGYLWRFGVYYCLLLQVDWTCLWWTLRKMLENNLCLYRKHWHNFGLPNPWLTERSPNFPIQSTFPFHLLQPPEPEWVSLKIQTLCSSERSAKALAMQFETPRLISIQHVSLCTNSQVSTVTIYWLNGPGFEFCQGQKMLSCQKLHNHGWGSHSPVLKVRGFFPGGGGRQLATQLHLGSSLKMGEAIQLVQHMPSWHGQEQLHFSSFLSCTYIYKKCIRV